MIQDRIKRCVTRAEYDFKELFYISDEKDNILLTDEGRMIGLPTEQNTFTLKYKFSTPQEWINELCSVSQSKAQKRYPFIYVNSNTVKQEGEIVTIGEMVIATLSRQEWKTTERDRYSFRPILNNILRLFIDKAKTSPEFALISEGMQRKHYFYGRAGLYGGEANKFEDYVDAIEINDLKLRLYKCYDK